MLPLPISEVACKGSTVAICLFSFTYAQRYGRVAQLSRIHEVKTRLEKPGMGFICPPAPIRPTI